MSCSNAVSMPEEQNIHTPVITDILPAHLGKDYCFDKKFINLKSRDSARPQRTIDSHALLVTGHLAAGKRFRHRQFKPPQFSRYPHPAPECDPAVPLAATGGLVPCDLRQHLLDNLLHLLAGFPLQRCRLQQDTESDPDTGSSAADPYEAAAPPAHFAAALNTGVDLLIGHRMTGIAQTGKQ